MSISGNIVVLKSNQKEKQYPEYLIPAFNNKGEVLVGYYQNIPPLLFAEELLTADNRDRIRGILFGQGLLHIDLDNIWKFYNHNNFSIYYQIFFNNYAHIKLLKTLCWLILDIDNIYYYELDKLCRTFINRLTYKPNFIINSGTGIHVLYHIKQFETYRKYMPFINAVNTAIQNKFIKPNTKYKVEYQPILKPFRTPGSLTKIGTQSTIYKIHSERYSIIDIAKWLGVEEVPDFNNNKPNRNKVYIHYVEDYEPEDNVISFPSAKKRFYNWYKDQLELVLFGCRYMFLFFLCVIAWKCRVPKAELEQDINNAVAFFNQRDKITIKTYEIKKAMAGYNPKFVKVKWNTIAKYTGIPAKRQKPKLNKAQHLKKVHLINKFHAENKKKQAADMYLKQNYSKADIARIMNLSYRTVWTYLKDIKKETNKKPKTYKYCVMKENIINLLNQNYKLQDIASELGITLRTVYNYVKDIEKDKSKEKNIC